MKPIQDDIAFWTISGLSCLLALFLFGCQRGEDLPQIAHREYRTAVMGRITLDGKPLNHCRVCFSSTVNGLHASATASVVNGEFTIPAELGPFSGTNDVTVEPELIDDTEAMQLLQASTTRQRIDLERQPLPAKYTTAGVLSVDVEPLGDRPLLIELTSR
jgi:hypothetical protein